MAGSEGRAFTAGIQFILILPGDMKGSDYASVAHATDDENRGASILRCGDRSASNACVPHSSK